MVGTHTESPSLRVKPVSKRSADGFLQVGVETYGGGMWHSWFDRDLGIAGRIMVRGGDGMITQKLVKINKPICRIPSLAIHLGDHSPFDFNKETNLFPILGLVSAELNRTGKSEDARHEDCDSGPLKPVSERHHSQLISLIAQDAGVAAEDILDLEMSLFDTQNACIGGLNDEFINSARLDNLGMTYCAVEGLIQSLHNPAVLDQDSTIRMVACFDHEEIGSRSAQGADSDMLPSVLRRLSQLPIGEHGDVRDSTLFEQSIAKSLLVSSDMAHSVNPNYSAKYESEHKPHMNEGPVIKINANARYATNSPGIVLLQEVARRAKATSWQPSDARNKTGVPLQVFVVRNDSRCGSTIGPLLSSKLGLRTIDIGNAQLAMHSIRETCGAYDVEYSVNLFDSFYNHYGSLEDKILIDAPSQKL